ncbi:MAG: DNA mismatch repair endonuclease MutL [Acutalibacteraceae bacterium]|nr:DNA mismatch repair endonuclease MutL [Acutalibacteraceae bacterium]
MPKINVLPKQLAELIAAGEVVERPASAVKELLENSIDAGADTVTVEIRNGGISYIRITDNGCGISREDIRNAFVSHATSKISTSEDLESIFTLGFRGEALASVSAVARVEVMTKTADEEIGTRYVIESGEEISLDDAGCPNGTTIMVRDLFYKTPARMKFLKKDVTEANAVAGVVDRIALSHPEVSIRFIREGKQVLITSGNGDLLTCIREVFGKDFSSDLIGAEYSGQGVEVSGYISKPSASRPNRNMQFFFLNNRLIKTGTGSAALSEGYKNSIMVGKFPSCVLNIKINPSLVDVNVHPAKTEVRFSDERIIFNAIYFACKNALAKGDTPKQVKEIAKDYYKAPEKAPEQIKIVQKPEPVADFWQHIPKKADETPAVKINFVEPKVTETIQTTVVEPNPIVTEDVKPIAVASAPSDIPTKEEKTEDILLNTLSEVITPGPQVEITEVKPVIEDTKPVFDEEEFHLVGEAFKTYIICEYKGKMVIIDKHAAHERIIYEKLRSENAERTPQLLLLPVTVTLSKEEYSAVLENIELINGAGFDAEDFGNGCVIIRECPMEITADDVQDVICEIAGRFVEKKQDVMFEKLDWIFHSVACRSAIKAGNFTSRLEMERFAKQLLSMPDIRYCPHGRPVLIEMTQRELEKNFGRI